MGRLETSLDDFGVGFQNWLGVFVHWFTNTGTGGVLAFGIVVLGLIVLLVLIWLSLSRLQIIKRATSAVTKYDTDTIFAASFEEFRREFDQVSELKSCFREFDETLIHSNLSDPQDPKVIQNTVRPVEFFNAEQAGMHMPVLRNNVLFASSRKASAEFLQKEKNDGHVGFLGVPLGCPPIIFKIPAIEKMGD
jgi:hypothetical protein